MPYREKAPGHSRPDYKPLNIIFALTQARMALADKNLELARKKYEEVLDADPENLEAKDFMRKYAEGKKLRRSDGQIASDCRRNPEGVCVLLDTGQETLDRAANTSGSTPKAAPARKKADRDHIIDEIFIITNDGLLVGHFTTGTQKIGDPDIMVGMLTAIQMFMLEAFGDEELLIKTLQMNKFDVFFAQGQWVTICVVASGKKTYPLRVQIERFLREVELTYKEVFPNWGGNVSSLSALKPMTLKLVTGGYV